MISHLDTFAFQGIDVLPVDVQCPLGATEIAGRLGIGQRLTLVACFFTGRQASAWSVPR